MLGQPYPTELQLNKANSFDTEAPFLDLDLSVTNGIVSSKIYDKRDDFNLEIVNFPFLDGDVPFLRYIYFATYSFCESMFKCYRHHQKKSTKETNFGLLSY